MMDQIQIGERVIEGYEAAIIRKYLELFLRDRFLDTEGLTPAKINDPPIRDCLDAYLFGLDIDHTKTSNPEEYETSLPYALGVLAKQARVMPGTNGREEVLEIKWGSDNLGSYEPHTLNAMMNAARTLEGQPRIIGPYFNS